MFDMVHAEKIRLDTTYNMETSRAELFRVAAHELKNPIQALVYATQLMEEINSKDLSLRRENLAHAIEEIKTTSSLMKSLVDNILDFNWHGKNSFLFDDKEFNMLDVMDNLIEIYAQQVEKKKIEFYSFFDLNIPNVMFGDKMRITQIMCNFCTESIKYTAIGHIEIRFEVFQVNPLILKMSCTDTGIGISKSDIGKIFEPKTCYKDSEPVGWSLSLPNTAKIVKAMNGEIGLTRNDVGTTFWAKIPFDHHSSERVRDVIKFNYQGDVVLKINDARLEKIILYYLSTFSFVPKMWKDVESKPMSNVLVLSDHQIEDLPYNFNIIERSVKIRKLPLIISPLTSLESPISLQECTKKCEKNKICVLVVEDEEIIQKLVTRILLSKGIAVINALNGVDGLKKLESEKNLPNIVIIDNLMPMMTGKELVYRIRNHKNEKIKNLPLLMISATITRDLQKEMHQMDCDTMQKPIQPQDLVKSIINIYTSRKLRKETKFEQ